MDMLAILSACLSSAYKFENRHYCLFALDYFRFAFSFFYVLAVVLLKGMGQSFLLSEDEPLTPNIDGVMAL